MSVCDGSERMLFTPVERVCVKTDTKSDFLVHRSLASSSTCIFSTVLFFYIYTGGDLSLRRSRKETGGSLQESAEASRPAEREANKAVRLTQYDGALYFC